MKRTYIIKLISGLFALSVLAVPFTGCEKAPSSSVPSGDSGEESAVVTEAAEPETSEPEDDNLKITEILPDHEYENVDHVELCGGKYYIYERMSEAEEKEVSVIASASTGEVKDLDISDAGYSYVQYAALGEKELALVYCDEENIQHLCSVDPATGKKSTDRTFEEETYLSFLRNVGSDEFTSLCIHYTETGKNFSLDWFKGSDLSVTREENLTEKLELPETAFVVDAFALQDGSAYMCSVDYKPNFVNEYFIYRMDDKGNITYKQAIPDDWNGNFVGMYVLESGNLCVCCTDDYSKFSVHELKRETGEIITEHTVETVKSNYVGSISIPGYDFTYITPTGITGYSFTEKKSEVVFKFGEDLDPVLKNVFTAASYGDSLYLYTLANLESGRRVTVAGSDNKEIFKTDLTADIGYASVFCTAPDGSIYYCETYEQAAEDGSSGNAYRFHVLDSTGKAKNIFTIDGLKEASSGNILKMRFGSDGNLYLLVQYYKNGVPFTTIYVTDGEGKLKGKFTGEKEQLIITDMFVNSDRQCAVCINSDSDSVITDLDLGKQLMTEKFSIAIDANLAEVFADGTGKYDLYYIRENTVYGYNAADGSETVIAALGSANAEATNIFVDSGKRVICSTYDEETGKTGVTVFEKG
ncbi:MAG: hypothetical protein ILP22_10200 [Oscillospiraceae bacterium]|nr:hypothetical protein [Oscillospiraceae bacterium]